MPPAAPAHRPTVLVTGASGFIGRRLVAMLEERGHRVIFLTRSPPDAGACASPLDGWTVGRSGGFSLRIDLAADARIDLPPGIDTIFHLAGKAHALAEVAPDEAEYARVNTEGTRRLLEAAQRAGVRAFVFFSSVKAVGPVAPTGAKAPGAEGRDGGTVEGPSDSPTFQPIDESHASPPDTPYGASKRAAEQVVLEGGYVAHAVVLRPSLVYGPQPKGNLEKMITAVRRGRFPPVPEFGNRRSMVHVDDVAAAAILAAERPAAHGGTYILADNEPFSTRQMFEWISAAVGRSVPRWTMPRWMLRGLARTGDSISRLRGRRFVFDSDALEKLTGDAWYSSGKIQRELGWQPRHTLRESLPAIVRTVHATRHGRTF